MSSGSIRIHNSYRADTLARASGASAQQPTSRAIVIPDTPMILGQSIDGRINRVDYSTFFNLPAGGEPCNVHPPGRPSKAEPAQYRPGPAGTPRGRGIQLDCLRKSAEAQGIGPRRKNNNRPFHPGRDQDHAKCREQPPVEQPSEQHAAR